MAVSETNKTLKVTLNVETAADTYKNRIFANVNPALVSSKIVSLFGNAEYTTGTLAALQKRTVNRTFTTRVADLEGTPD